MYVVYKTWNTPAAAQVQVEMLLGLYIGTATLQGKQINQRDQTVTSDTFCFCFIYFSVAIDRNENIRNIEKKEKSVLEQQSSADERLEKGEKKRDNI